MIKWFNETKHGFKDDIKFRFRGQESNALLKYFPKLILKFLPLLTKEGSKQFLLRYFHQLIYIRKLISFAVRLEEFTELESKKMITEGRHLFRFICKYDASITPSLWVLCNAAPSHAKETLTLYGLGSGVNSMEGREQKHQRIKKYMDNTIYQNKWPMVFRHEFLQLVYLREMGLDEKKYIRKQKKYIPDSLDNCCHNCGIAFVDGNCPLCDNIEMTQLLRDGVM